MKLYEVTVEYVAYVVADDEHQARQIGEMNAHEESLASFTHAREVDSESQIDVEWRHSIPYGDIDGFKGKTCSKIVAELHPPPPYEDPSQMKLPGVEG